MDDFYKISEVLVTFVWYFCRIDRRDSFLYINKQYRIPMKKISHLLLVLLILLSIPARSVYADVAPPETVPGSNLVPGGRKKSYG